MTAPITAPKTRDIRASRSSRVAQQMKRAIEIGDYSPGMLLPARRHLATQYGVSLATVELAIKSLIGDGSLRAENGRGTFVSDRAAPMAAVHPRSHYAAPQSPKQHVVLKSAPRLSLGIVGFFDPEYEANHPRQPRFAAVVIEAFERAVTSLGGVTHFSNTHGHPQTPEYIREAILGMVADHGIQAVLIATPRFQVDVFQAARISPITAVVVENQFSPMSVRQVYYDSREDGYHAANVLLEAGHDRLVYLAPYTSQWVTDRLDGANDALAGRQCTVETFIDFSVEAEDHLLDQEDIAAQYVPNVPVERLRGAGVVACNDAAAVALIAYAARHGLVAGEDYSIVGFDDLYLARDYGLATFRPPLAAMGQQAAHVLFSLLEKQDCPMRVCLNSEFVMRKSLSQAVGHNTAKRGDYAPELTAAI